ncbi:hypothetical protein DL768_004302 [Monosporascus sp. mg162]|nr:hypothetical protein DL768_004302 [Monosporascus sp. mg162]
MRVMDATTPELQPVTPADKVVRLGALPLQSTGGGVHELAVRQTDAMAVRVKSEHRFKLKVSVGGVNVANPFDLRYEQGYYVTPPQEWIDGVYIGNGRVRQFSALPSQTGHSIAEQVPGADVTAGFEIQVFAPRGIALDSQNRLRYHKARETPVEDMGSGFSVLVVTSDYRKRIFYNLEKDDWIWHLKACIQDVLGTSGLKQELAFLGEQLSDPKTRGQGEILEMLKRLEERRVKLNDMREVLRTARANRHKIAAALKTETKRKEELARRLKKIKEELERMKKIEAFAGPAGRESLSRRTLLGEEAPSWETRYQLVVKERDAVTERRDVAIHLAPGGRIAQTVEQDTDPYIWNNDKPIHSWRVQVVDFEKVKDVARLPPLPSLSERPSRRGGPPPLDSKSDNSGFLSVAHREAEHPSPVPFGTFAVMAKLPPAGPPAPREQLGTASRSANELQESQKRREHQSLTVGILRGEGVSYSTMLGLDISPRRSV